MTADPITLVAGFFLLVAVGELIIIIVLLKKNWFWHRRARFREGMNEMLRETEREEKGR